MKSTLYLCLTAIRLASATFSLGEGNFDEAFKAMPVDPENPNLKKTDLTTSKNDAFWQEAMAIDLAVGPNSTGARSGYYVFTNIQQCENSTNTASDNCLFLGSASFASLALQKAGGAYPADFNQAQALTPQVEISTTPQQTIKSFGVSGAWWPNDLNLFPPASQANLSALLFDKEWLYASGYRYAVGATGDNDQKEVLTYPNPLRLVQSFMKTDGNYDWTRDGPGIYYLKAAVAAKVPSIAFFVNAQPSALTQWKQACGTTLDAAGVDAYVAYLVKVLTHWTDEEGIPIEYISPMNEPNDDFQKGSSSPWQCHQEGMKVPRDLRATVFKELRAALAASASVGAKAVKIMGDETSQVTQQALKEYTTPEDSGSGWLVDTLSGNYIDAIAVHMYDWPDDVSLRNFKQLVINASAAATPPRTPPPIKMTEISSFRSALGIHKPWGKTGTDLLASEYDPTIDGALDTARMIWQWMTLVNAESWDWWTAVSTMLGCSPTTEPGCASKYVDGKGYNDAFIFLDPNYATNKNYEFYLTKRFWVFKHFTTFIRPGSVRYDIPNESLPYGTVAMASQGTDHTWNAIFINRNMTEQKIMLKLPGINGKVLGMTQTTAADDWKSVTLPVVSTTNTVEMVLPARSVLSLQFSVGSKPPPAVVAIAGRDVRPIEDTEEASEEKVRSKPRGRLSRWAALRSRVF